MLSSKSSLLLSAVVLLSECPAQQSNSVRILRLFDECSSYRLLITNNFYGKRPIAFFHIYNTPASHFLMKSLIACHFIVVLYSYSKFRHIPRKHYSFGRISRHKIFATTGTLEVIRDELSSPLPCIPSFSILRGSQHNF